MDDTCRPRGSGASLYDMEEDMKKLEEKLGYSFGNPALLENALTHSSYANENRAKGEMVIKKAI